MRVTEIIGNQSIRLFRFAQPETPDNVKALKFVRALEARYGFYQGPRQLSDYDLGGGMTFLRGQFRRDWFIDKFQIFNNGILVEGKVETVELDAFLDDALAWSIGELQLLPEKVEFSTKFYLSQIEIEVDDAIGSAFIEFSSLGKRVSTMTKSYGQQSPELELSSISLQADISPQRGVSFIFARREGKPFSSNLYFSSAPLSSADHLSILGELLSLLSTRTRAS